MRAALLEANVMPWNGFMVDHVAGTKVSATTFDASGRRHSAADLLAVVRPSRLHVAIRATVTRIITSPIDPAARHGRSPQPIIAATGVVYQDRLLDHHQVLLRPGVVPEDCAEGVVPELQALLATPDKGGAVSGAKL